MLMMVHMCFLGCMNGPFMNGYESLVWHIPCQRGGKHIQFEQNAVPIGIDVGHTVRMHLMEARGIVGKRCQIAPLEREVVGLHPQSITFEWAVWPASYPMRD